MLYRFKCYSLNAQMADITSRKERCHDHFVFRRERYLGSALNYLVIEMRLENAHDKLVEILESNLFGYLFLWNLVFQWILDLC